MSERHEQLTGSVAEARAAVVATEEAVRVAVERAREVTLRLERLGSGRHLSHELVDIEGEIDHAWKAMHEAEQRAYQLEQAEKTQQTIIPEQPVMNTPSDNEQALSGNDISPQHTTSAQEPASSEVVEQIAQRQAVEDMRPLPRDVGDVVTRTSRIEQIERIERIDEEEEIVEMNAAMTAADITAAAAAEAEAFAEASSARVRELRRLAEQAEKILERVHVAIQRGVLVGDAAEATLYEAEHDASHAHTLLADAEATEERARRTAMNAEAEAEVAEGMARATQGRFAHEDYRDAGDYALETTDISYSRNDMHKDSTEEDDVEDEYHDNEHSEKGKSDLGNESDEDDTLQLPSIRLKEQQNHRLQDK